MSDSMTEAIDELSPGSQPPRAGAEGADITVLVVDDEASNLASLEKIFQREGMRVFTADGAKAALELVRRHRVQVVLTDLMMPGTSGAELLRALKEVSPDTEVVLMTAYGTVETAVQAMRDGAYDFVEKPLKRMTIVKSVRKAAERQSLVTENRSLRREIKLLTNREIVGQSPALRRVLDVATQAAPSSATVLILGESGTGKELIARYIHSKSGRANGPFVGVNCAAIPESILEAELFGHERGAFTGAIAKREGRFARARGGTLFLDEIGELSPAVQVKILRVLQEGEYEPVGGHTVKADARIVAATNRDLVSEVEAGRFREDLYYRLNVIAVTAPPLRARREDIPLLVDHFLGVYCTKNGRARLTIPSEVLRKLMDYSWPGNVRELENVVERAAVLCRAESISLSDLPDAVASA
ncbi:MAG TPA: sigma-54 dependent transcriptional regulator, partial [Polyangiaceae bacterium]|nr:sigma-54 dependent transcriptional regulator [Polyangiaceae bacterium]